MDEQLEFLLVGFVEIVVKCLNRANPTRFKGFVEDSNNNKEANSGSQPNQA